MQTALADFVRDTAPGREADAILRACVHCGFCNATCPTYQLLNDELDGPRGRIYLMKQVLEGAIPTRRTQLHLDRCLTCRACETTCPSGVRYGRLLEIGRELVDIQVARGWGERVMRYLVRTMIPYPRRFRAWLGLARRLRLILPATLRRQLPESPPASAWPAPRHARRMLVLDGCAQPVVAPGINAAAARVLDRLGISLLRADGAGCCGALSHHTSGARDALAFARRNIDAWWPAVERGVEAIVITASGCGVHVQDYGQLLRDDTDYAAKAARVAHLARDIGEILASEDLDKLSTGNSASGRVAFQSPCTLQHGQKLAGAVENILTHCGYQLTSVANTHLCCGAAGSYVLLQRQLAQSLLKNKIAALQAGEPDLIVTANIGCLLHLRSAAAVPVRHWIELLSGRVP